VAADFEEELKAQADAELTLWLASRNLGLALATKSGICA